MDKRFWNEALAGLAHIAVTGSGSSLSFRIISTYRAKGMLQSQHALYYSSDEALAKNKQSQRDFMTSVYILNAILFNIKIGKYKSLGVNREGGGGGFNSNACQLDQT